MEKPKKQYKSGKYISMPEYNEKVLYNMAYIHPDCMEMVEEAIEDRLEEGEEKPQFEEWWYHTDLFSLKDLLRMSEGLDPSQVFISVHRERDIDHIDVKVEHRNLLTEEEKNKWLAEQATEEAEYQKRLEQYNKDKAAYDLWKAEEELKVAKNRIAQLKGVG